MHNAALVVVYLSAAALLVTGIAKFRDPVPTALALKLTRLPYHRPWVWTLAAVEVILGVAAIVRPSPLTAGLLSVLYVAFTLFLFRARAVGAGCGCLGPSDRPPSGVHVALDLVAAIGCAAAAFAL